MQLNSYHKLLVFIFKQSHLLMFAGVLGSLFLDQFVFAPAFIASFMAILTTIEVLTAVAGHAGLNQRICTAKAKALLTFSTNADSVTIMADCHCHCEWLY